MHFSYDGIPFSYFKLMMPTGARQGGESTVLERSSFGGIPVKQISSTGQSSHFHAYFCLIICVMSIQLQQPLYPILLTDTGIAARRNILLKRGLRIRHREYIPSEQTQNKTNNSMNIKHAAGNCSEAMSLRNRSHCKYSRIRAAWGVGGKLRVPGWKV